MNLVSLLILPAINNLADGEFSRDPSGGSRAIAGARVFVLIGAVAFSKRKSEGMGGPSTPAAAAAEPVGSTH